MDTMALSAPHIQQSSSGEAAAGASASAAPVPGAKLPASLAAPRRERLITAAGAATDEQ